MEMERPVTKKEKPCELVEPLVDAAEPENTPEKPAEPTQEEANEPESEEVSFLSTFLPPSMLITETRIIFTCFSTLNEFIFS